MMNTLKITAIFTLFMNLSACSNAPIVQDFPDTANPTVEVTSLSDDMTTAITNQVNVLSPYNFEKAQDSLASARKSLDQQKDPKDTLHRVAEGRAYLIRSNEFAKIAHENIEDVIIARQDALKAGAQTLFSSDFKSADHDLRDVTADFEKNELKNGAKQRTKLQASYLDLELKSIKLTTLGKSRDTIALALKEGAKKYAPRSLAIAEKSEKDSDAFINANRHETEQVTARTAETQAIAEHLLKITRDSKMGKKTSSEDTALLIESDKNKIVQKQVQLNNKETQLANEQGTTLALTEENKKLEKDQAFNRSFDEARAEFTSSEAEVYKQGNTLMIRLRGLEFPSSKAVLKGSNFPLLAKVQKIIKDFGKSSIIVEGHTDSVGGKILNEKLSTDRAQAVKEYFVSNAGSEPIDIKSIGYDYQKPLATNKTASGRAQNRRVDVLIQAEEPGKL